MAAEVVARVDDQAVRGRPRTRMRGEIRSNLAPSYRGCAGNRSGCRSRNGPLAVFSHPLSIAQRILALEEF